MIALVRGRRRYNHKFGMDPENDFQKESPRGSFSDCCTRPIAKSIA